ncbi:Beta-barrel assembly-enhancing protease [bacterium HR33]|nr:Beta-barrel assembly-enhancing protease [bacterium HR33]
MRKATGFAGMVVALGLTAAAPGALASQSRLDSAWQFLARGRYGDAEDAFRREMERGSREAARGLVLTLREVGRYPEAASVARRAELWLLLGRVLLDQGRTDQADSAFRQALNQGRADSLQAELQLAVLELERGNHAVAMGLFDRFVDFYNRGLARTSEDLAAVAAAARFLGRSDPQLFKDALRVYDEAIAADSGNTAAWLELGEMFLEKFNGTDARATFEALLRRNPRQPGALYGLARVARFEGSREAEGLVRRSLEVNPNLARARALLAEILLDRGSLDDARVEAGRALSVNPREVDALAVLGAVLLFSGDETGLEALERQVTALYPRDARFYARLAEIAARSRRYDRAVALASKGVQLDPQAWRAYAVLGINQLRLGQMAEGRANLERAFAGDPYDPWTKNTLDLLDVLDRYSVRDAGRFRLAADSSEAELLYLYLADLAIEAYDSLRARYGADLPVPVRVELYSRHADFSVRTVGLVGLGALGASFGPVIAMDGPSARPAGEFHWASTFWHELAHSFHLRLSEYRVPRWFTEGLAVYEERRARPGWGANVTPDFLLAFKEGRLRRVGELDRGFVEPEYPEQVLHSYYQASLICELLAAKHGPEVFRRMLGGFRAGKSTEVVLREVAGTDLAGLQREFEQYVRTRFGLALSSISAGGGADRPARSPAEAIAVAASRPGDFLAQLAAGKVLWDRGEKGRAEGYLLRARELFPQYGGKDSPYWYLARLYRERGELERAASELGRLTELDASHYEAWLELAAIKETLGDLRGAISALEQALYVYPFEAHVHVKLAELAARAGDWGRAIRERRAVVALGPTDMAEAEYQLARAYFEAGEVEAARRAVLRALERAPSFREAQELLLAIRAARREDGSG